MSSSNIGNSAANSAAAIGALLSDADTRRSVRDAAISAILGGFTMPSNGSSGHTGMSGNSGNSGNVQTGMQSDHVSSDVAALREQVAGEASMMLIGWNQRVVEEDETGLMARMLQERLPGMKGEREEEEEEGCMGYMVWYCMVYDMMWYGV